MKNAKILVSEIKNKKHQSLEQNKRELNLVACDIFAKYKDEFIQPIEHKIITCVNNDEKYLCINGLIYNKIEKICKSNYTIKKKNDINNINDIVQKEIIKEFKKNGYYCSKIHDDCGNVLSCIFWKKSSLIFYKIMNSLDIIFIIIVISLILYICVKILNRS